MHNVCIEQKVCWGCGSKSSFRMAGGKKKRFSAGEIIETIFNDEDSNDKDLDCGSNMEICPDSKNEENSDIDILEQLQRLEIERQQHEAIAIGAVSCTY